MTGGGEDDTEYLRWCTKCEEAYDEDALCEHIEWNEEVCIFENVETGEIATKLSESEAKQLYAEINGGEDDECGILGCYRVATDREMCTVCNEAYQQGFTMGKKQSGGVRGAEEIDEKLEELKERDSGVVYESSMGSIPARCTGEIRALKWVRGVRDDL